MFVVSAINPNNHEFATSLIRQAASETGADFNFLVRTAARESNFDASATAQTSSAAGMYQFIEQTWLSMVDRHGEKHGLGDMAKSISRDANGRFQIEDPQQRSAILDLRFDAGISARMAGELASENADIIEGRIGREPSSGELYAAHFLGANGAAGLITAAEQSPASRADTLFPAAAQANRAIFYDNGAPRSASQVLAILSEERPVMASASAPGPIAAAASAATSERPIAKAIATPISPMSPSGFMRFGEGELSPALMELLASLEMPSSTRSKDRD
jgi:hypothetical protein